MYYRGAKTEKVIKDVFKSVSINCTAQNPTLWVLTLVTHLVQLLLPFSLASTT